MNETTNDKILGQVMEKVGANGILTSYEALLLSLQLLGWAKMSRSGELREELTIQQRSYADPNWLTKVGDELIKISDTLRLAYANWNTPSRLTPSLLLAAVDLCIRLAETGMIDTFDPTDSFVQYLGKDASEYAIPPELADVMTNLAMIEPHSSVYTPWLNSIQLASRAAKRGASVYMETMRVPLLPSLIGVFAKGQIIFAHGDPIREPSAVEGGELTKFDVCLAFPQIGLRYTSEVVDRDLYGRFGEQHTNSGTLLSIWHIMAQTRGRVVIVVPHSLLFSAGYERAMREELLRKGIIEAVIAMPSGLLSYNNLSFALLVLNMSASRKSIRFVNADDDRFREPISKARAKLIDIEGIIARATGSLTDELVAEMSTDDVLANDTMLLVSRYVLSESTRKTEHLLSLSSIRKLGEIVSILRPMPTISSDKAVKAWEVGTTDLPEFAYIAQPTKEVRIDPDTSLNNLQLFLQPLDIVVIIKGSVGKVGIVPENVPPPGEGGWIVGQSAVILRVIDHRIMSPKVLCVYLRSPIGKELMEGIAVKGATISLIHQRELRQLQVVIPSKKDAVEVGNVLDEQARIQLEIEDLRTQQAELAKLFWTLD